MLKKRNCSRRKTILFVFLTLIIVLLLVWSLWPCTFTYVTSVDINSITSLACSGTICYVDHGEPQIDSYILPTASSQDKQCAEIIDILNSSHYRRDLSNLFLWNKNNATNYKNSNGRLVNIAIVWGVQKNENCLLSLTGSNSMKVSIGNTSRINYYHFTEQQMLDELIDYLQTYAMGRMENTSAIFLPNMSNY